MYDKFLAQKQEIQAMREENVALRARIHQQEQTKAQKVKVIREFQMRSTGFGKSVKSGTYFLSSLKKMHKEVRTENEKLRKELRKLQENPRFTEVNELEGEHKAYIEEMQRLQEMMKKAENSGQGIPMEDTKAMNAKMKEQNNTLEKLNKEKNRLLKEIEKDEQNIENYKKKFQDADKQNKKNDENQIEQNRKEIEKLKEKLKAAKNDKSASKDSDEVAKLKKARDDTKQRLKDQEKKIYNIQNEIEETKSSKEVELNALRMKSQGGKKVVSDKVEAPSSKIVDEFKKNIGGKSISEKELKEKLFEPYNDDEKISLHELARLLTRAPCKLSTENALKLAEYVVEAKGNKPSALMKEKPLSEVLKKLRAVINEGGKSEEIKSKEKSPEPKSESKSEPKSEPKSDEKQKSNEDMNQEVTITEEQLIEIFKKCIQKIKEQLNAKHKSIEDLFAKVIFSKNINDEEEEVVRSSDFFKIIKDALSLKFNETEEACLSKIMSVSDDDDLIRFQSLVQIVNELDVKSDDEEQMDMEMNFTELDKISLVLLFALVEYMLESKNSLENIFSQYIYKQDIEIDDEQTTIDLIDSGNFFKVLDKIGISMEDKEHENLKDFLCIDKEYSDKLVVNKLKKALEEFETNEELRKKAFKYYQELAEENGFEEDEGSKNTL